MSNRAAVFILFSSFLLASSISRAEEARRLPEIAVAAPALGGVAQEAASTAISEIIGEELKRAQITRLEDALALLPGVTVRARRGIGLPVAVALRGVGPRNVRVFIDGVEVSDPSKAQSQYAFSAIDMADVERIRLYRGPQPGRFGSEAGGGVIAITTKPGAGPFGGETGFEIGSFRTKKAFAAVRGQSGAVDYRLRLEGENDGGFSDYNQRRGGEEKDPYRGASVDGRLGWRATDSLRFDLTARYLREDVFYDASTGDRDWNRDETERFVRLSATHRAPGGAVRQTVGIADALTTRVFHGQGTRGDSYDGGKTRIDYVADYAMTDWASLEAGADAERARIDQKTPGFAPGAGALEEAFWKTGAFASLGLTPNPPSI